MKESAERKSLKNKSLLLFTVILIAGLAAGCITKLFIFDFMKTSGQSMTPSIKDGEVIFVNKLAYGLALPDYKNFIIQWKKPEKNDVVVFLHENKLVVKRCVLTEGDSIEISRDKHYTFTLRVGENYIPLSLEQEYWLKSFEKVPEGFIFVAGDNFENSIDSRNYGFVSAKNITGKIIGKK